MKMKRIICNVLLASMIVSASPMYAFGDFFKGLFNDLKETTESYVQEKKDGLFKKEINKAAKKADKEASKFFLKGDSGTRLLLGCFLALGTILGLTYWAQHQEEHGKEFSIFGTLLALGKVVKKTNHGKKKQKENYEGMKEEAKKATTKDDKKKGQSTTGKAWNWFTGLFKDDNKEKQESNDTKSSISIDEEIVAGLAAGEE